MTADLKTLLVEDDDALAAALVADLRTLGHDVTVARDGQEAIARVGDQYVDAIVLDRMLPAIDGMSVLQRLRHENVTIPIVMLTALGRSAEKIEGLMAGADDYVVKPVTADELDARLRAALRGRGWTAKESDTLRAGDITVSPTRHRVWRAGKIVDLPKLEFDLLVELARHVDTVMTRTMLIERVWGYDFDPRTNVVDTYIRRLRTRLMADGGGDPITTVRGVGYALNG